MTHDDFNRMAGGETLEDRPVVPLEQIGAGIGLALHPDEQSLKIVVEPQSPQLRSAGR